MSLRCFSTLLFAFLISSLLKAATDVSAGPVEGTWTAVNSPYNINGDIRIDTSKTLTIEAGVIVNFTGRYEFKVLGSLQAIGTVTDTIKFTSPDEATVWDGMKFYSTGTNGMDSSRISYCLFEHGRPEGGGGTTGAGGAIHCIASPDIVIRNAVLRGNYAEQNGGGIMLEGGSDIYIVNTLIEENGSYYYGGGISIYNASSPTLRNLVIRNNRAGLFGGGIHSGIHNCKPVIISCQIYGNVAIKAGGGLYFNDTVPLFDEVSRTSVFSNRAPQGMEFYSNEPVQIPLDTFTVASPTSFHAYPAENFTFDIVNPLFTQVDADLYVDPSGDDGNDGLTPGTALKTIYHAQRILICDESNPHTIHLAAGTYSKPATGELYPVYGMPGLTLRGEDRATTILDGNGETNLFAVYDCAMAILKGLTLQNGAQEGGEGGAVYVSGGPGGNTELWINDVLISGSEASEGGGIFHDLSVLHLEDVEISDNNAPLGGGIYSDGTLFMDKVTFDSDSSEYRGGAIYAYSSNLTADSCSFTGNYASSEGGGIWALRGSMSMSEVTFSGNVSDTYGGAIYADDLDAGAEFHKCMVTGNTSATHGGGFHLADCGALTMEEMLFAENETATYGSAVYAHTTTDMFLNRITMVDNVSGNNSSALFLPPSGVNIDIANSIIRGNGSTQISGATSSVTWSNIQGGTWDEGCIDADPLFTDPASDDYTLSWSSYPVADADQSPSIDTGDPSLSELDPDGTRADMGYRHFQQTVDFQVSGLNTVSEISSDSAIRLDYTFQNLGDSPAYADTTLIYLSADNLLSVDDSLVKATPMGIIDPAVDSSLQDTVRVAPGLEEGDYYFLVHADALERVTESNELNNLATISVTILQSPKISLQPSSDTVCPGDSTGFSILAEGSGPLIYQWYHNGTELTDSTAAMIRLEDPVAGNAGYYYCEVSNSVGSLTSDTAWLGVLSPATINSALRDTALCAYDSLSFVVEASGTMPLNYQWYKDGGALSGKTDTMIMLKELGLADAGSYSCMVENLCGTDADTALLQVNALPLPDLGIDTSICEGSSMDLDPGAFQAYEWSPAHTERILTVSAAGKYKVTVTDANGCRNTDSVQIGLNALPMPELGPDSMVCTGELVELDPGVFSAYHWSNGHTTPVMIASDSGTYFVEVTDVNGCTNADTVSVAWYPVPVFSLGEDTSIYDTESIQLMPDRTFEYYLWSTGDDGSMIHVDGSMLALGPHTYWCRGTDEYGCSASDTIVVTIEQNTTGIAGLGSSALKLWPNPAEDRIYMEIPNEEAAEFTLYITDLSGRICRVRGNIRESFIEIPTDKLSRGTYFVDLVGPVHYRAKLILK